MQRMYPSSSTSTRLNRNLLLLVTLNDYVITERMECDMYQLIWNIKEKNLKLEANGAVKVSMTSKSY